MKITDIKPYPIWDGGRNLMLVKVETDEGIYGWGEAGVSGRELAVTGAVNHYRQFLIGEDPMNAGALWQHMYRSQYFEGGRILTGAISAIDIALYDIKGKALGVPVYELLGGAMRDRIWAYGRFDGDTPELAAEHARAQVDQGFSALKGDPFAHYGLFTTPEVERDAIAKVQAVREEVGQDVELMLEAHGRLTVSEAIRLGHALEASRPS